MARRISQVEGRQLTVVDAGGAEQQTINLDSAEWFAWLNAATSRSFSLHTAGGAITFRREQQRRGHYWYAYHGAGGKLQKAYAGRGADLTAARLDAIAFRLTGETATAPPQGAELLLLGPPRLTRNGREAQLPAKGIALLGYVAVQEPPPTREQLLALLWPESSPDAARKNLRNLLWTIRSELDDVVEAHSRIALRPGAMVDVRELLQATKAPVAPASAVELYRGAFLDGLVLQDAPELEIWLTAERDRMSQIYLRLVGGVVETTRAGGEWHAVIDVAQRGIRVDPLHEPLHRAVIEAYARLGERAEALRRYDALQQLLDRELGVAPLPETEALVQAVRDGGLDPVQPRTVRSTPRTRGIGAAIRAEPFVGRYTELAMLDAALTDAAAGRARVVALTGGLGVGKTRLWHEWSLARSSEIAVLEARCLHATQELPFAPLLDPGFMEQMPAAARVLLARERAARPAGTPAAMPLDEERHQVFEACAAAFEPLLSRPLVFFLDNLQWADPTTLAWLSYLLRRYAERPLLLVVAQRVEEAEPRQSELLAEWERGGLVLRLPVPQLTADESAALLRELGAGRADSSELYVQSGGNPYYLIELARVAPGTVPPVLAELVRARVEQLSAGVRQILQAAVVLEPNIDFATLRRTSGRDEEETLDALDVLLQAGLIAEQGGHYAFGQPFLATVVRSTLSSARQAVLHRRAAEAQAKLHAGAPGPIAAQLMEHYLAAGDTTQAARYADQAAEHALHVAATAEAIALARRALELEPTVARQISLGTVLSRAGDDGSARPLFVAAYQQSTAHGERLRAAQAALGLAMSYLPGGYGDDVVQWATTALRLLTHERAPAEQAYAHMLLGAGLRQTRSSQVDAEAELRQAITLARTHGLTEMLGLAHLDLGNLLAERGDLEGALVAYQETIRLAHAAGNHWQETLGNNNAAYHALLLGQLAAAKRYVDAAVDLAERYQLEALQQWLCSTRGELALAEQAWDAADQWFVRGQRLAEQRGNPELVAGYQANRGRVAWSRGAREAAIALLEAARADAGRLPMPYLQTRIDLWLAEGYAAQGALALAADALDRAEARLEGSSYGGLKAWAERVRWSMAEHGA